MNISSIVVRAMPQYLEYVENMLKNFDCLLHFKDDSRLIITIEANDLMEESKFLKEIEKIDHVVSADIMYSYNEDEINKAIDKMESIEKVTESINDNKIDANNISYSGDINNYPI